MTKRTKHDDAAPPRDDANEGAEPRGDASHGPDETGIGAQSRSSPQGDGAEKAPRAGEPGAPAAESPAADRQA